jgi:Subtilase family/GEVED domain/Secretion system C-terminal sorting domain
MLYSFKKCAFVFKCLIILSFLSIKIYAQVNQTNVAFLKENAIQLEKKETNKRTKALALAQEKGWETFGLTKNGKVFALYGVDDLGMPLYKITENNIISAATINTNKLYTGGSLGLNLSGSTMPNDKVAIWDGGAVLTSHVEFPNQKVEIKDGVTTTSTHATHVAGTIAAIGNYQNARGMAYGLPKLLSFDFNNDNAEMSNYAASLLLSNHSYGSIAGWYENTGTTPSRWEFRGQAGENEDYKFGYYSSDAQEWDRICYNAPYYLPVKSAGNYRSSNGPAVGQTYYRFNTSGSLVNAGARPEGISSNDGYDILGTYSVAKNIMTVAAVNPLPYGTVTPSDITISSFSAWGPTDDGRIKPDISADGVDVTSTSNAGPNAYTTYSGTSMSAPSVTGSLVLLQELYYQKYNTFMRSSTLKALTLGTASEAGPYAGPDYIYGWGLMNTENAAKAILNKDHKSIISELSLIQGATQTINVVASGDGPIIATICWTDPEIDVIPVANALNNRTLRLVNDLDIRASAGGSTYFPWILDPSNPAAAAGKGDNFRDNVEQIYIEDAVPGKTYTFTISHKGTLQRGGQAFSIVITGVGGNAYCASTPLSSNDSKITNFKLANIDHSPTNNCSSYNNFTDKTIELEKGRTYPLNITLGSCGGNFNKIAKVYIDWNSDGNFNDTNELVATSQTINGNEIFAANITVPVSINTNNFSLLRVVLNETNDPNTVNSCGTYLKGETQDYRIKFLNPASDVGITSILDPLTNCANPQQTVSVIIRNFGTQAISAIPVTVSVKDGANTLATFNGVYGNTIKPSEEREFTLPGYYHAESGKVYAISAKTTLNTDPIVANDETNRNVQFSLPSNINGDATAYYCDNSKKYTLSASGEGTVFWYKNETDAAPIAYGNEISTTEQPTDNNFYAGLNEYKGSLGPKSKYETRLGSGTYLQTSGGINVRTFAPVILESARLYIGNSGTIRFYVVNNNGIEVSSSTVKVTATRSNPAPGITEDDLSDQGQIYVLNLKFPSAGNYSIYTSYEDDATIFRNSTAPRSIYPLSSELDIFNIIGNNASTPYAYYYYFYDITVKALGCPSMQRIAAPLSQINITRNGDELLSNIGTGNQWYINDEKIEGATLQKYKPTKGGKYRVEASPASGCTMVSTEFMFLLSDPTNENEIKLKIFPIPTIKDITIAFEIEKESNVSITILNTLGQKIYQENKGKYKGKYLNSLNVNTFTSGVYIVSIKVDNKIYNKKITII